MTAEQLLNNTSHMDWLTTSQKMLVEAMMETYKELALEEVKNNVALHNVSNSFVYIVEEAKTHNAISYLSSYEKAQEEIVRLKARSKKLHINTQKIY